MAKATIQYRQLKRDGLWPDVDLKAMVVDVLRRRNWVESARTRIIDLDQDESYVILNKISAPDTWDGPVFAGQLIQLQAGSDVHAIIQSLEEDAEEFVQRRRGRTSSEGGALLRRCWQSRGDN